MVSLGLVLALLGAARPPAKPASPSGTGTPAAASSRLASDNLLLRRQLDLASGDTFYYTLDPVQRRLRFMYQGNLLFEKTLLDVEVGTRRGFLGKGSAPRDWAERVWSEGRLTPQRVSLRPELDVSSDSYEKDRDAILVPPTPEEAYPAPSVWWIRYEGGMAIEVHGLADTTRTRPGFFAGLQQNLEDAMHALSSSEHDVVRIRLYLPRAQADMLYRSVPPDTRFTILPLS